MPLPKSVADWDPGKLSGSDKMMLFGAMLKDAVRSYNGEDGNDLANTQSLLAQRQALARKQLFQQKLGSLLAGQDPQYSPGTIDLTPAQAQGPNAPQFDAGPTRTVSGGLVETAPAQSPLTMNDPRMAAIVMGAQDAGYNMDDLLKVFTAQQPNVQYDRGYGYNAKTGNPMGGYHPDLDKGMVPGADGVVRNAPGYVPAAAEAAGAVAGAQEAAKAGYDMVEVKVGGQTVQLPRAVALPLITAAFSKNNPGGLPQDFGRTPSPEEQTIRTGRAQNQVKQEGMVGEATTQAGLDLPKVRDQAQATLNVLEKIRKHPSLDARTGNSTLLPAFRPQDVDFDVMVKQIGGGAFLEAIQALRGTGQISEIEGAKATDAIARMQNQRQSKEGFLTAMKDYETIVRAGLARTAQRAAGARGGSGSTPMAPAAGQRHANTVYQTPRGPLRWTGTGWVQP